MLQIRSHNADVPLPSSVASALQELQAGDRGRKQESSWSNRAQHGVCVAVSASSEHELMLDLSLRFYGLFLLKTPHLHIFCDERKGFG